jgi:hypothetical protein
MFPRNKRRMRPLDSALILRALVVASELGTLWSKDQTQQDKFAKLLDDYGLKSGGALRDSKSGGSRTYEAQFEALGLLYNDGENLALTQAGEDLVSLENPVQTLQYQILKCQYPSTYSAGRMVRIDPAIRVRPFVLLLRLAADPELDGLSDRDAMIPVVFGDTDDAFSRCKVLIKESRLLGVEGVIPDSDHIRTPRTLNNTFEQRLRDIKDIANTFKNVMQGADLIDLRTIGEEVRFFPKGSVWKRVEEVSSMPFVDFSKPANQALLDYGRRVGAVKDTRRVFMPRRHPELHTTESLIAKRFLETAELPASERFVSKFSREMQSEFGLTTDQVHMALSPILRNVRQYAGARLIELSTGGGSTAEAFERAVERVFELEFGYETQWTGRKRSNEKRIGGFADVYVVEVGRSICGIIDTKATNAYELPHQDVVKMLHTYIPAAHEIFGPRPRGVEIGFITYISHLIRPGAESRAQYLYEQCGVPVSLCSAYGLNNMREDPEFFQEPERVTERLRSNSVVLLT